MVSGHTGNVVPRKGLRVRAPCPPLLQNKAPQVMLYHSLATRASRWDKPLSRFCPGLCCCVGHVPHALQ